MARVPRLTVDGEPAVYHVISRTALNGFVLDEYLPSFQIRPFQPHLIIV
jgi:hypothetical protein